MDQQNQLSDYHYCHKFDITREKMQERLALLGLGENEYRVAQLLHSGVIEPHKKDIVAHFYRLLMQNSEFMEVMTKGYTHEQLKLTFEHYLHTLAVDFVEPSYFESRLRIGMAHVAAGVSLSLYQCANRILQQLLIDHIPRQSRKQSVLAAFILKITTLDMSLAIEAYHNAQVLGLFESLRAVESRAQALKEKYSHDSLTRVLSRESIIHMVEEAITTHGESRESSCVIMADLDHFKDVNDNFGHLVGDGVLSDVAERMNSALRQKDIIGRYGGEEFVVLLQDATLDDANEVAERIRGKISDFPVKTHGVTVPVTISQGIAQLKTGETVHDLIDRADKAMYQAKQNGRNRVEIAE